VHLRPWVIAALAAFFLLLGPEAHAVVRGKPVHGIALYGEPKYGPDFTHFDYVNPDAPKGGTFVKANEAFLTFDTFNAYTLKGAQAYGADILLHDTLMMTSQDEAASAYGLIAETIEIAPDGSWVQFVLRPEAKFSDGSPITATDVVFSFNTLITKATPVFRITYADVEKAEATAERTVRFILKSTQNSKLPLALGAMPVFSQAYWKDRDFSATTLDIPVVSGPYNVDSFEVGRYVLYKRLTNYWGKDLPATRGQYNFDHVRYEYFRDDDVEFEAFKTGAYDFTREMVARRWATQYDFPAVKDGRVRKLEVPSIQPRDVTTFVMNLRRPLFRDRRVRQAINLAFDFESVNKTVLHGAYDRLRSYWQGSPLEAKGLPSEAELKLLEPFRAQLPPELFTTEFTQPVTAGDGNNRENLLKAQTLLKEAGWEVKDGRLLNAKGEPFAFEITIVQPNLEQVLGPWIQDMKRVGIEATLRVVDTSQYANRVNDYDYDAIYIGMTTTLTPGQELLNDLGSQAAKNPGSYNYAGIDDPVVDSLVETIINATTYEEVTTATRALDRVLTFNAYHVLRYTSSADRYAYWSKLKMPAKLPALGLGRMGELAIALWWADPAQTTQQPQVASTAEDEDEGPNLALILGLVVAAGVVVVWLRRRRAT
jgi:microcin C transport system substrate-binding protein